MPAPIIISVNETQWLKQYLQNIYHIDIQDSQDCKKIHSIILAKHSIKVSYNTLRRIFNLMPSNHTASTFTLNSLAIVIGFDSWKMFKSHVAHFDTNAINQTIQLYAYSSKENQNEIIELIKHLQLNTWIATYQLQFIINIAIDHKDFNLLSRIASIDFDLKNQKIYKHLVIAFQGLYFQAINNNKAVISFVQNNIADSVVLQKCLMQAYVNEQYLSGFMGLWFNEIKESSIPDFIIFKQLLLCQKCIEEHNTTAAIKELNAAIMSTKKSALKLHPILQARTGVWKLVLKKDSKSITQYFNALKDPFDIADFVVIASRLIWLYYNKNEIIPFLDKVDIKTFPVFKNFFQKGRYNMLLLSLAINNYHKKEKQKALLYYKQVETNVFGYDIVNIEFYQKWINILEQI